MKATVLVIFVLLSSAGCGGDGNRPDAGREDSGPADSAIPMEDSPSCSMTEGPFGGPQCRNGEDDDCDGLIDTADPDCLCATAGDCDDSMDCTIDQCADGECQYDTATDGTACTQGCVVNGECTGGECTGGMVLDADGDGDPPTWCRGTDCNDSEPRRAGTFFEGPAGDAACSDSIDNDCDDGIDELDVSCNPPVCRESWCWGAPQPQGLALEDLAAVGADGLIAVGGFGTILHWDGHAWSGAESGTTADLSGVWVAANDDAWAVGTGGTILRWNGATWSTVMSPTMADLASVSGTGASDVWAVGAGGQAIHWNGSRWDVVAVGVTADLHTVEAATASGVWIGADDGVLVRGSGMSWASQATGMTGPILSLATTPGGDLVIGGETGQVLRYDGSTFAVDDTFPRIGAIVDILVRSDTDILVVSDFGSRSDLVRWNGTEWSEEGRFDPAVAAVAVTGSGMEWGAGSFGRLTYRRGAWTSYSFHIGQHSNAGAWPVSPTELWLGAGFDGIQVWDGVRFRANPLPGTVAESIFGFAGDDVWVAGNESNLLHWDGSSWTETSTFMRTVFPAIWGRAAADVWSIARDASATRFIRRDGMAWADAGPASSMVALSGTSDGHVWAVGRGTVRTFDGSTWSASAIAGVDDLVAVDAVAPDDVWAVGRSGARGAIVHFDGVGWSVVTSSVAEPLLSVSAGTPTDVWASGNRGLLMHYDGMAWTRQPQPTNWPFRNIRARDGSAWMSYQGAMLYHAP